MVKDEFSLLFARIDDLLARADRGEMGVSPFLSPRERHFALGYIKSRGLIDRCFIWGGYPDAERCRAYILPDYISDVESYEDIAPYAEDRIVALRVCGSGYRKLSHRDYLGSLLGLGIEREVLGDIVFESSEREEAIVFCDGVIADFICEELRKVASDTVKVKRTEIVSDFIPHREFLHISDTVASARLDCVVAALCSLSREKASSVVIAGLAEVDFETESRPDRNIVAPCLVSVRGYGKFRVNSVSEQTRRGRLRLDADKYL